MTCAAVESATVIRPRVYRDDEADELLRAYHRLKSQLVQVPGRNPRGVEGMLYDPYCPKCGGAKWRKTWSRTKGYRTICAGPQCGEVWPTVEGWLPPGLICWNRRYSRYEGLLPKLATIERLLFARPRRCTTLYWEMCCWCWARHVWKGETAEDIAEIGREQWIDPPRPFTWYIVRDAWQYARQVVGRRIHRVGIELALGMEN